MSRGDARLPPALRASAVPRWSHRDPVEGGNPFPPGDRRAPAWQAATETALRTLRQHDRALDSQGGSAPYHVRIRDLAAARFDIWAQRGLVAVDTEAARRDFEDWLQTYVANWLAYVADTCPRFDIRQSLQGRLAERRAAWLERVDAGREV